LHKFIFFTKYTNKKDKKIKLVEKDKTFTKKDTRRGVGYVII